MLQYVHGGEIYDKEVFLDFSVNTNPFGMPEGVVRVLSEFIQSFSRYPDDYNRDLKKALAKELQTEEEEIICANGASDLLYRLCQVIRPKRALLTAPSFVEYERALRAVGCDIFWHTLKEEDNFTLKEDFLSSLDSSLDIIFLCNPANPVGNLTDRGLLVKTADLCQELGILLVLDECFLDFVRKEESFLSLRKKYPGVFFLRAFTKFYSLAGLRLGYGICTDKALMDRLAANTPSWNVSLPAQLAGVEALKDKEYRERTFRWLEPERDYLREGLTRAGYKVYPSACNFLLFRGEEGLYEEMLRRGILIRECKNYRGLGGDYYRIGVKLREDNDIFLKAVENIQERG